MMLLKHRGNHAELNVELSSQQFIFQVHLAELYVMKCCVCVARDMGKNSNFLEKVTQQMLCVVQISQINRG